MNYTGTGSVWFDDLSLVAIDSMVTPVQRYEDDRPVPAWSEEQKVVGYVCYARDYLRLIFPTSQPSPSEINAPLSCFAAPGEQEPVAFVVRSIRELEDVRVSCSALTSDKQTLLGSDHLLVRSVRYGKKKGQSRWGMFQTDEMVVPLYLSSVNRIHIPPETSQQYWITVRMPRDTVPGRYRGTVTIAAANAKETRLPLEVDVLPFQLREPDHIYWGMYHRPVGDEEFRIGAWHDMREHGMNSVGLCCNLGAQLALEGGEVSVTFDGTGELERSVREYQQAGFVMPIAWLMGSDVMRWCQAQAEGDEQKFADYYRQIIVALLAQGERNRWPEIIIQPIDEPFEHTSRLDEAERCLRILKTVPELRTEEDGPNGNPGTLERLYDLCDVLVYHDGPVLRRGVYDAVGWGAFLRRLRHDGKEVWFYNMDLTGWHPEVLRFGYGFGLSQAGGTGAIQWSYQIAFQPDKPRLVYDKTDSIIYQYPQAGDGPAVRR